ncbi:phosphotyrosine protein phosphatase [Candidatus Woesearchaeota archaeon]|nr:phosphotyrosine protein phosphatase [Candidatus Woesearchaeota archaeon]
MNVLFICNQNQNRSKTAEDLFRDRFTTRSAGLYNDHPVTEQELAWADVIAVMDDFQRTELAKRFPQVYLKKRIISLNVPDVFKYHQPELVTLLNERVAALL